jgi:hypothetical protein
LVAAAGGAALWLIEDRSNSSDALLPSDGATSRS